MEKKILFVESRYNSFYGAQKSMLQLIKSLDKSKFNYKVITTDEGNFKLEYEKENIPVNIIKLGKKANVFGGKVLKYNFIEKLLVFIQILLYNFKILKYSWNNKIDVIYVNDLRAFIYSILAVKLLRKKSVWYIRADLKSSFLTRFCLKHSTKVITIAHGVLRNLPEEVISIHRSKITNIYTGFNFNEFNLIKDNHAKNSLDIPVSNFVIGYLGSINERKGIDLLIESYISLAEKEDNVYLLIVGNISEGYQSYWDKQIDILDKTGVDYKYLSYTNSVSYIYRAMDVFVLPSRSEGLPRVLIEAMGHKIPVIATDVGGTKEIILNETFGQVISPNNTEELISSIRMLLKEPEARDKISVTGSKHVRYTFSMEKFTCDINNFFKSF